MAVDRFKMLLYADEAQMLLKFYVILFWCEIIVGFHLYDIGYIPLLPSRIDLVPQKCGGGKTTRRLVTSYPIKFVDRSRGL